MPYGATGSIRTYRTAKGSSESAVTTRTSREAGLSPMSQEKKPVAGSTTPSTLPRGASSEITPTRVAGGALVLPGTPHCTTSLPRTAGWQSTAIPSFFRAGRTLWYQVFVVPSIARSGPCPGTSPMPAPSRETSNGGGRGILSTAPATSFASGSPSRAGQRSHPAEAAATRRTARNARLAADALGLGSGTNRYPRPWSVSMQRPAAPSLRRRDETIPSAAREGGSPFLPPPPASSARENVRPGRDASFAISAASQGISSTGLPPTRTFPVAGLATNAAYFARALVTNSLLESVSAGPDSFTTLAPGAPVASATVSGRTASSIAATVSVTSFGAGSDACTARLEASTDGFATVASFAETALAAPGSVAVEVSGLSPVTGYALRLCVTNPWGLTTLVDLGSATTLPASGLAELYVDSLGSGNGSSPESALPTIRAALDIASPGSTIWVRGGADRAYGVTNETDTLPIPATLEGLSIRAYDVTPGDGGRALVSISDTYIVDGNRANIVSNRAANVTLSGLDFSFGTSSVGKQNVGSCSILWTAAPFTTLENCLLRMPQPTVYAGSGAASPLVICTSKEATNFVVRGCEFRNTRCWSATHGYSPIKVKSDALIACNVFSNVNATVTGQQADLVYGKDTSCYNLTFVSNVVYGANDGGNLSAGLLFGLYPGPKSAEIAFNRFVADPGARAQNGGAITHRVNLTFGAQFAEAFSGKEATLVHHNTIIGGQSAFLFNEAQGNKRKNQFFSNLILLDTGGTVLVENVKAGTTEFSGGRTTSFIAPSFLRNNAYTGVLTGGSATELATYDLSGGLVIADNVALAAPPDFVCTNDIYSPDFYRYRSSRTDALDLGVLAWRGENNEYPPWIGAKPPLYPAATVMILR